MLITEDVHYYTNSYDIKDGILRIDRVYLFDEDRFADVHWDKLGVIYASLPEYRCSGEYDVPYWFGREGADKMYLWISAEPPGFQVAGELPLALFLPWEEQFHVLIGEIPFKPLI